jgi:hypothetical protein
MAGYRLTMPCFRYPLCSSRFHLQLRLMSGLSTVGRFRNQPGRHARHRSDVLALGLVLIYRSARRTQGRLWMRFPLDLDPTGEAVVELGRALSDEGRPFRNPALGWSAAPRADFVRTRPWNG